MKILPFIFAILINHTLGHICIIFCSVRIFFRQNALTCTKYMPHVIGTICFCHLHIVRAYLSISFNDNLTFATWMVWVCQYIRHI